MMVKEAIIVEGKDDIAAVKRAVDAQVIATGGARISKKKLDEIKALGQRSGLIILTDPDYAGEKIRKTIAGLCPRAKHAFIAKDKAVKDGDLGIENSSPEDIRKALEEARAEFIDREEIFSPADLAAHGLTGGPGSKEKREVLGQVLGLGYCNSKQLVKRLNGFGVSRLEFDRAIEEMEEIING